jgi:hypothetical protein
MSLQFLLHTMDLDPSVNTLGPKRISQPIGSLGFDISVVLDPIVSSDVQHIV